MSQKHRLAERICSLKLDSSPGTAHIMAKATDLDGANVSQAFTVTVTTGPARLANISTRGLVATGDNILIGGFIISGSSSKRVLVRGIGPSLVQSGVTNGADGSNA